MVVIVLYRANQHKLERASREAKMLEEPSSLLTVKQVQERLNLSRTTVYQLLDEGALRGVKIGTSRRVYNRDLESYIKGLVDETEKAIVGASSP